MIPAHDLLVFALAAFVLVISPGPNMMYLLSRAITQGPRAGLISLLGVITAFLVHIVAASVGLTAVLLAVPLAYALLKYAGAAYLLWLAWQAVRPGGTSPFASQALPIDPPGKLFRMGFLTNLLNPKAAVFYLSLFPQFIQPERGSVLTQSLMLGLTQMTVSFTVNAGLVLTAGSVAGWFGTRPAWQRAQRWLMGTVLAGLAVRLALDEAR